MALIGDLWSSVPPITRTILLTSILLTGAVSLDLCTPLKLYFNYNLIKYRFQFWRIFTCLFYFGEFSVDTIFDFFILYRYSIMLESESFRNKPADFILFFVFGSCCFIIIAIFFGLEFLSPCISSMMLYLWCRRNSTFNLNFLEIFHFRAPFLPWALIIFVSMFGYNPIYDIVGACVGHVYYFLEDVVPKIPETRDVRMLKAPSIMVKICDYLGIHNYERNNDDFVFEDDQNAEGGQGLRDPDQIREEQLIDENNDDEDCKIRRKPDSVIRSLITQYRWYRAQEDSKLEAPRFIKLFTIACYVETMFYFPNRFSTIVALNTKNVAYTATDEALLSLMQIMFKMQNQQEFDFQLSNMYGIYKYFFASTLFYEAGLMTIRLKVFENLQKYLTFQGHQSLMLNSFAAGVISQQLFTPLIKLHIANHNYKIGNVSTFKQFFQQARGVNQNIYQFLFLSPASLLMKGGLSGIFYLGFYKKILGLLDDPTKNDGLTFKSLQSQNIQVQEYMERVQDDNEVLKKLIAIKYYDQSGEGNLQKNISPFRNILIASLTVSIFGSVLMAPIDLLVLNQLQAKMYGSQQLRNIKLYQIYSELRQIKGLHRIMTMVITGTFVRNIFFVTSFYSGENYLKNQLIKE